LYRPSIKELLAKDFFAEDTGFKVELAQREELVKSDKNDVNFRLRSVRQPRHSSSGYRVPIAA
jgi:hypothetical protein